MIETILPSEKYQYQVYANHKQLVAIKSAHKPKGNIRNLIDNKGIKLSTITGGKFSGQSRKKLKETIYNWAATVFILKETTDFKKKHKNLCKLINFHFITLTLPKTQSHSDIEMKLALNRFLWDLQRTSGYNFNYVWRAETQENGNIHFHILLDHYYPQWLYTTIWNKILDKLGYLSGLEYINPISVNVKTVKSLKHVWSYLHKYCSKTAYHTRRGVQGHQWGSSQSTKNLKGTCHQPMTDDEFFTITTKAMQNDCNISYVNDFVTVIYFKHNTLSNIVGKARALEWLQVIKENFDLIQPTFMNYQWIETYTSDDYTAKHSYKFNYLDHCDDTNTTKHYERYAEIKQVCYKMKMPRKYLEL